MSRKNRKTQKSVEQDEPIESSVESTGVDQDGHGLRSESASEELHSARGPGERSESAAKQAGVSPETETPSSGEQSEFVDEDPLADVRQSLIEEEAQEGKESSRWWRRMIRGRRKQEPAGPENAPAQEAQGLQADDSSVEAVDAQATEQEPEEYLEEIDELIGILEDSSKEESDADPLRVGAVQPEPAEPVRKVDLAELKKQAFRPTAPDEEPESYSEVREIALQDDESVFVEVESKVQDPLQERLSTIENALKPYGRYINFVVAFLGIVLAVLAGLLLFNIFQQSQPVETPAVISDLPFPTSVSLPGGWSFNLGKGRVQEGQWNPQGAEWLEGTEVCRWVALPWSRQLEAVLRTLNPDDPIELVMSNNDRLEYRVYSVRQLTAEEMMDLDSNSPCLLVVLAQAESESRWVLTALP